MPPTAYERLETAVAKGDLDAVCCCDAVLVDTVTSGNRVGGGGGIGWLRRCQAHGVTCCLSMSLGRPLPRNYFVDNYLLKNLSRSNRLPSFPASICGR